MRRPTPLYPLALLILVLAAGCASGPTEERFARSFDRVEYGDWMPEVDVPPSPPDGPAQVIWEVTRYPDRGPTSAQKRAAREFRQRSFEAAQEKGWFDYERGMRDGFERQWNDENHYYKWEYITDDRILDPERPEYLMYYPTEEGQLLAGVMYLTRKPLEHGPQIGGPLTVWHYHLGSHPHCFRGEMILLGHPDESGVCPEGVLLDRTPEMLHVWFVEHPEGPFATRMKLDQSLIEEVLLNGGIGTCCGGEE